jgi:ATP-dependent Clp protease ATP-binding subunit ClpC
MELPKEIEKLIGYAASEASFAGAEALEPLHLFIAVCKLKDALIIRSFEAAGVSDLQALRRRVRAYAAEVCLKKEGGPHRVSGRVLNILDQARLRAISAGRSVDPGYLLMALLDHADRDTRQVIEREKLPTANLIAQLGRIREQENFEKDPVGAGVTPPERFPAPAEQPLTPMLDQYGKDYTALVKDGRLDPVIGRREEIKQVARVLLQKQKNNPVLVGEAGVGKTAIVEGLAERAAAETAPEELRRMRIIEVMLSSLVAGTKYRGEFEERLQQIVEEAEADPNIVLFFDEIHTLVGAGSAGGSLDAANILKPAMARGRIRCIGATTAREYRQHIEKDPALERRFQPVRVEEPTREEARAILLGLRDSYEAHHRVKITEEAIDAALDLSIKHLTDRRLPDKARDLMDQAAVRKRFSTFSPQGAEAVGEQQQVTRADIAEVVAAWTGIPVERLSVNEQKRLLEMEAVLRRRVVGQDEAIGVVSNAVRTALTGLSNPSRPFGVFLFMGATGVGKTELSKALAEFLFGDEQRLLRFDMSEYMEEHSVSKLIGAPPGYVGHGEGGLLVEAVRKLPYSVLLFDEVEKAHPRVSDIFLQIFDEGRLRDAQGRMADFRHTVIILTSNLSAGKERKPVRGFVPGKPGPEGADNNDAAGKLSREELQKLLLSYFRPELVNRLTAVVQFRPLGEEQLRGIIDRMVARVQERLSEKDIRLQLTPPAYDALAKIGYKPEWGAREMDRAIEVQVVQPLAQGLLEGKFTPGQVVYVLPGGDGVSLSTSDAPADELNKAITAGEVLHSTLLPAAREPVAMLLIDIVKSTELVQREGDTALMTRIRRVNDAITSHPLSSKMRFLKFTGDGFLSVYNDVTAALAVAHALRETFLNDPTNLRLIIHYGSVHVGFGGDPVGAEVHRLFRVEALDDAQCVAPAAGRRSVPEHSCVVITPAALGQLPTEARERFELLGKFRLKGFDEAEEIWAEIESPIDTINLATA